MMNMTVEGALGKYVYHIDGRTVKLDKDTVDRYSELICPMSEEYVRCLVEQFGNNVSDNILSSKIALGMTTELKGLKPVHL